MEIYVDKKYMINGNVIKNYISAINSINEPMSKIKMQIKEFSNSFSRCANKTSKCSYKTMEQLSISVNKIFEKIKKLSSKYPNEQTKIYITLIKQIIEENNGIVSARMLEPIGISRQYLSILENNNEIERISRGIYQTPDTFEDSFYSFQSKYKKAIFSHMNSFYFFGLTEEFPYNYTVTVPQSYHVNSINEKCNVFYVSDDILELGVCEVDTPNGNKVKVYDLERSICDIIRSKNRMDLEQVKKTIRKYLKSSFKDLNKISEYSKKMGINKLVMEWLVMLDD